MEEDIAALTVAIEKKQWSWTLKYNIHANRLILYLFYRNSYHDFRNTGMPNVRFNIDINATETFSKW
jgi:hypothetical protein